MRTTLLALLLCFNFSYSQSTRTEKLTLVKQAPAKLLEITTDKTVFFEYFSKDKKMSNYSFGYGNPDFKYSLLTEDPNYPDYIVSIEFKHNPVKVTTAKEKNSKDVVSNTLVYESRIEATMYVTDRLKGIMHQEQLRLKNQPKTLSQIVDNVARFKYSSKSLSGNDYLNSTLVEKEVQDINLKAYYKEGSDGKKTANKTYAEKVNNPQISKLERLAKDRIKSLFFKRPYNEYHTFHYIKKFKGFDIEPFNKGLALMKDYLGQENKDSQKVKEAITVWKEELKKLDLNEKRQKKLYLNGLENLARASYLIGDTESLKNYIKDLREARKKDDYMSYYLKIDKAESNKIIEYLPIPKKLYNANRYNKKNPDKINYIPGPKGEGNSLNMILINELTSNAKQSQYTDKQLFVAFNQMKLSKKLKKIDEEAYNWLKTYKKEVKSLWTKQSTSEFFKGKTYESIQSNLGKGFDALLKQNLLTEDETKGDLKMNLYKYYANAIIIRNNNLQVDNYNVLNESLKPTVNAFVKQAENPRVEIFYEIKSLFENKSSIENVKNLSKKEVQNLRSNIIKFCELIK